MEALAELPDDLLEIVYVLLKNQQPVLVERRRLLRGFFTATGFRWFVHEGHRRLWLGR